MVRYPILSYFVLSFVLAWSVWIPAGLYAPDTLLLAIIGGWAPTLAALLLTILSDGKAGVRLLLRKLLKWRVSWRYYIFAIFSMVGLLALAAAVHALLGGTLPTMETIAGRFGLPPAQAHLLLVLSPLIFIVTIFGGGPIAEELGWRGYAQPRLQARVGAGKAGLVIGFIWSLWHLPLFWYFPSAVANLPLLYYVPLVTAFGVLFAWLYHHTDGSVLLCILFHAGINFVLGGLGLDLLTGNRGTLLTLVGLVVALALIMYRRLGRDSIGQSESDL